MTGLVPVFLRWSARATALFVAGVYCIIFTSELLQPHSGPPSNLREWAGIALLTATCAGMLAAWRWELAGAIVSLAALTAFVIVIPFSNYAFVMAVAAVPGILYLADWLLRRKQTRVTA